MTRYVRVSISSRSAQTFTFFSKFNPTSLRPPRTDAISTPFSILPRTSFPSLPPFDFCERSTHLYFHAIVLRPRRKGNRHREHTRVLLGLPLLVPRTWSAAPALASHHGSSHVPFMSRSCPLLAHQFSSPHNITTLLHSYFTHTARTRFIHPSQPYSLAARTRVGGIPYPIISSSCISRPPVINIKPNIQCSTAHLLLKFPFSYFRSRIHGPHFA